MSGNDYYKPGDYNSICWECGRERKFSELKQHWKGYYVCPEHWEPRHPQDFVRGAVDNQTVPYAQPEPADTFVTQCESRFCISDIAEADCAIADYTINFSMDNFCVTRICFADLAISDCAIADKTSY